MLDATHLARLEPERERLAAGSDGLESPASGPVGIPRCNAAEAGPGHVTPTVRGPASSTLETSSRREICF